MDVNRFYDRIRHRDAGDVALAEPAQGSFADVADAHYAVLVTYRRSGEPVPTPVWFAPDGERLVFRTGGETAKVKRIRRDPRARIAPSTLRGKPTGPPVEARARVLEPGEWDAAEHALDRKYGMRRRAYLKAAPELDAVYVELTPA